MATDKKTPFLPPEGIPVREDPEAFEAMTALRDAVHRYRLAEAVDPLGDTVPADHPSYLLQEMDGELLVRLLEGMALSTGAGVFRGDPRTKAFTADISAYLRAAVLARLDYQADGLF